MLIWSEFAPCISKLYTDVRMDVRGTNEFKEISLTLGQELRPVSGLHQTSALHSDCSSLKPKCSTLNTLIREHHLANWRKGRSATCTPGPFLTEKEKKIQAFHLPTGTSNLAFCLPGLERFHLGHPPGLKLWTTYRQFFSSFQLLLLCNVPGAHSWEKKAALITPKGDAAVEQRALPTY